MPSLEGARQSQKRNEVGFDDVLEKSDNIQVFLDQHKTGL